jgi:hypothetical protein
MTYISQKREKEDPAGILRNILQIGRVEEEIT